MSDLVVVTQLTAKRSDLVGLIDVKRGQLNAILKDHDHLDAFIKLFALEKVPELLPVKRRARDRTFARHELTWRIFNQLRPRQTWPYTVDLGDVGPNP